MHRFSQIGHKKEFIVCSIGVITMQFDANARLFAVRSLKSSWGITVGWLFLTLFPYGAVPKIALGNAFVLGKHFTEAFTGTPMSRVLSPAEMSL